MRIASFSYAIHNCKFELRIEHAASSVFHLFNVTHLVIWLTLIIHVRFDDQTSYFRRVIKWAYLALVTCLFILGSLEALFIFVSEPFIYQMVLDLMLAILYTFTGWKLLATLRSYSSSHFRRTKGWIIYIGTVLVVSFLI